MSNDELLRRVVMDSKMGTNRGMGLLTPAQGAEFVRGLPIVHDKISVYREFKPMQDAIEYTVIYHTTKENSKGEKKFRLDFTLDWEDFEEICGDSDDGDFEKKVSAFARLLLKQDLRYHGIGPWL